MTNCRLAAVISALHPTGEASTHTAKRALYDPREPFKNCSRCSAHTLFTTTSPDAEVTKVMVWGCGSCQEVGFSVSSVPERWRLGPGPDVHGLRLPPVLARAIAPPGHDASAAKLLLLQCLLTRLREYLHRKTPTGCALLDMLRMCSWTMMQQCQMSYNDQKLEHVKSLCAALGTRPAEMTNSLRPPMQRRLPLGYAVLVYSTNEKSCSHADQHEDQQNKMPVKMQYRSSS
jgi:hypothetical protein